MNPSITLTGADQINAALAQFVRTEKRKLRKGLRKAGLFIKGEAVQLAPIDYGALRGSAFSSSQTVGSVLSVRVGFTAEYAGWVHEMPMTLRGQPRSDFGRTSGGVSFGGGSGNGVYWQDGENKFLQKALTRNTTDIRRIIEREASF